MVVIIRYKELELFSSSLVSIQSQSSSHHSHVICPCCVMQISSLPRRTSSSQAAWPKANHWIRNPVQLSGSIPGHHRCCRINFQIIQPLFFLNKALCVPLIFPQGCRGLESNNTSPSFECLIKNVSTISHTLGRYDSSPWFTNGSWLSAEVKEGSCLQLRSLLFLLVSCRYTRASAS